MITLDEHIKHLQDLKRGNPNLGRLPIIYGADDEGNDFLKVIYAPGAREAINIEGRYLELKDSSDTPNCVCIN